LNDLAVLGTVREVQLERRAEIHAALGDPVRLAIVDELATSDRSPSELSAALGVRRPHLAFHLDTLERAGLVRRVESSGDRRRKYVQLADDTLSAIGVRPRGTPGPVVFVCTRNSARSQLAAALWRRIHHVEATSAGTHPADRVHPAAVAAAHRAGLDLGEAVPRALDPTTPAEQIITVCDQAHEELQLPARHWSIPDPVEHGSDDAFDRALDLLRTRINTHITTHITTHILSESS
jgi:ArsR family transcriptional regulator, arsenate/arsenite/antimonite-responsive transcriptional repressor / arsenate reductase (thioredoxin)